MMKQIEKETLHRISGGTSVPSLDSLAPISVSRPPPPYESDGYPWIKPPYEPEEPSKEN